MEGQWKIQVPKVNGRKLETGKIRARWMRGEKWIAARSYFLTPLFRMDGLKKQKASDLAENTADVFAS